MKRLIAIGVLIVVAGLLDLHSWHQAMKPRDAVFDPDQWTNAGYQVLRFNVGTLKPGEAWTSPPITATITNGHISFEAAKPRKLYVVRLPDLDYSISNVFEIQWQHEPNCDLVRYLAAGRTNEFHAWMVKVLVERQP
jgi:hypothetical protein